MRLSTRRDNHHPDHHDHHRDRLHHHARRHGHLPRHHLALHMTRMGARNEE